MSWLDMARIVRGQTISLKEQEFIEAARVCGTRPSAIIFRHIVPNVSGLVVIYASLLVPGMILFESFLSFLGLISVNLGIINILPIPVLDGGHLLYYFIELIRGKPLSEYVQEVGLRVGLVMVLSLMVFSIFNDNI